MLLDGVRLLTMTQAPCSHRTCHLTIHGACCWHQLLQSCHLGWTIQAHDQHASASCYAGAPGRSASPGRQVQSSAPGAAVATAPAEGGAQSVEAAAVPLAKDVIAVIDAAKQEVEVAAKAYYASKVDAM